MLSTYIYKEEKQNPPSSKLICLYNKVIWGLRFEKCYEMFETRQKGCVFHLFYLYLKAKDIKFILTVIYVN